MPDHGVVGIDKVVGGICEECWAFACRCPLAGRVGMGCEFRLDGRSRAESRIIQNLQILPNREWRIRQIYGCRMPIFLGRRILFIGVSLDQAGIRRNSLPAHQTLGNAPYDSGLEQVAQQVAVAELGMAVLGECGMIRNPVRQIKTAEPAGPGSDAPLRKGAARTGFPGSSQPAACVSATRDRSRGGRCCCRTGARCWRIPDRSTRRSMDRSSDPAGHDILSRTHKTAHLAPLALVPASQIPRFATVSKSATKPSINKRFLTKYALTPVRFLPCIGPVRAVNSLWCHQWDASVRHRSFSFKGR